MAESYRYRTERRSHGLFGNRRTGVRGHAASQDRELPQNDVIMGNLAVTPCKYKLKPGPQNLGRRFRYYLQELFGMVLDTVKTQRIMERIPKLTKRVGPFSPLSPWQVKGSDSSETSNRMKFSREEVLYQVKG